MSKTANFLAFIFGAAVGSIVMYHFIKTKYEQLAEEEIESVKEAYSKRYSDEVSEDARVKADQAKDKPSVAEYAAQLKKNGYVNYASMSGEEEKKETEGNMDEPYVISPDQFGEVESYDTVSLTYYADRVLADDNDMKVENAKEIIGEEALGSFGEYEDDSVYVRNDRLKCDYEILLDQRTYAEVLETMPKQRED